MSGHIVPPLNGGTEEVGRIAIEHALSLVRGSAVELLPRLSDERQFALAFLDEVVAHGFQYFATRSPANCGQSVGLSVVPKGCIVAFGIASRVAKSAIAEARRQGIKAGLIRPITLWPFPAEPIAAAAERVKSFISVELSMGQLIYDVRLASGCKKPVHLCNRVGGMITSPDYVLKKIIEVNEMGGAV